MEPVARKRDSLNQERTKFLIARRGRGPHWHPGAEDILYSWMDRAVGENEWRCIASGASLTKQGCWGAAVATAVCQTRLRGVAVGVVMSRNSFPIRASPRRTIDLPALILALGTFAIGTDAFIIGGILPKIAHDLSVSVGLAGLVVSVFSLSYAFGSPIVAALSARWRRSTVIIGGLAVFSAANLLSGLSPTFGWLLATRVVAALAAGLVAPACYALASTLGSSHNRGEMLAIVAAGFTSAIVLGVPLGVLSAITPAGGVR